MYNKASLVVKLGAVQDGLKWLYQAIQIDAKYREIAQSDKDFSILRSEPEMSKEFERITRPNSN
jgi:hypothetical protein